MTNFICSQQDLMFGISTAAKATSNKAVLPVLSGIKFETLGDKVKLTATDLEIGIECHIPAKIISEGSFVISSKTFSDVVRKLPPKEIVFEEIGENNVRIKCSSIQMEFATFDIIEFPQLEPITGFETFTIDQGTLRNIIRQTIFAISKQDETRPILTGGCMEVSGDTVKIVALDGFRLSTSKGRINSIMDNEIMSIVPRKALEELLKILSAAEQREVTITVSKSKIFFELDNIRISSRLIEGLYMNYKGIIPKEFSISIKMKKEEILESIERASLIAMETKGKTLILNIDGENLFVESTSDNGKSIECLKIENINNNKLRIGFNYIFLLDALRAIDTEEVVFNFSGKDKPCVIKPDGLDNSLHLVLPVRLE